MSRTHLHVLYSKGHLNCSFEIMDLVSKLEATKEQPNLLDADALENGINMGIDSSICTVLEFFGLELVDGDPLPVVIKNLV